MKPEAGWGKKERGSKKEYEQPYGLWGIRRGRILVA